MTSEEIIESISRYYPQNISPYEEKYEQSKQHKKLLQLLENRSKEKQWKIWVDELKHVFCDVAVIDLSSYSFSSPCRKLDIGHRALGKNYVISIYISLITPLYIITLKDLDTPSIGKQNSGSPRHIIHLKEEPLLYFVSNSDNIATQTNTTVRKIITHLQDLDNLTIFPLNLLNTEAEGWLSQISHKTRKSPLYNFVFDTYIF